MSEVDFFLTLVCQVLFFLDSAGARACPTALARHARSSRSLFLLGALGLESWPDARLALDFALARGSRPRILA